MSNNRVAILTIHGMGSQGSTQQDENNVSYSAGMYSALRREMGESYFDEHVAWREVFWSDVLQGRQRDYVEDALEGQARWMRVRKFVMHNLTDASAYRVTRSGSSSVYDDIHQRVFQELEHLEDVAGAGTPLIVVAHSLGAHIMSNYIYDLSVGKATLTPTTAFQQMKTMCSFVTFGCNIPIFTFAYPPEGIKPIEFPGDNIPTQTPLKPWWLNLNDKDDALGMPLAATGGRDGEYAKMVQRGELSDEWVNAGNILQSWNPLSHGAYWTAPQVYRPLMAKMQAAIAMG